MNEPTVRPARRRLRRTTAVAAIALGVVAVGSLFESGMVHADAAVVSSDPADGSTIATSPTQITIVFSEELGTEANTVTLDCNTELVTLGRPEVGDDGLTLTVAVPSVLPKGTCVANWLVSDTEGAPNGTGIITFSVSSDPAVTTTTVDPAAAAAAATSTTLATTTAVDPNATSTAPTDVVSPTEAETGQGPLWLGRLLSVLGVGILFGSLVTIAAAWPEGVEYLVAVRFVRMIWFVALLGTVLYVAAATAAATGGSFGSGLNPANWLDLFDAGATGIAAIARLILVLGSGWVAFRPDRVIDPTTQMAALGIPALAVATMGFSRTGGDLAAIGIATGILHALAMAIWIGGVVLLARVVLAGPGEEDLVHAVRGFCRISNVAIVVTVDHRADPDRAARRRRPVRIEPRPRAAPQDGGRGDHAVHRHQGAPVRERTARQGRRDDRADGRPSASCLRDRGGDRDRRCGTERVDVRPHATELRHRHVDRLRDRTALRGARGRSRRHGQAHAGHAGTGRDGGRGRRPRVRPVGPRGRVHRAAEPRRSARSASRCRSPGRALPCDSPPSDCP